MTLSKSGVNVTPLSKENPLLSVSYVPVAHTTQDADITGLKAVSTHVTQLHLGRTAITDASMRAICNLPRLTRLDLHKTTITDQGLTQLKNLKYLESLNLHSTQVTDKGLKHLSPLKQLKHVYLWGSKVSPEGAKALQKALPDTEVHYQLVFDAGAGKPRAADTGVRAAGNSKRPNMAQLAKKFTENSCCSKAHAKGQRCSHGCCKSAMASGKVCTKCNPGAR
jgi:hypothetical protein